MQQVLKAMPVVFAYQMVVRPGDPEGEYPVTKPSQVNLGTAFTTQTVELANGSKQYVQRHGFWRQSVTAYGNRFELYGPDNVLLYAVLASKVGEATGFTQFEPNGHYLEARPLSGSQYTDYGENLASAVNATSSFTRN
jgi:hypothetical protein